MTIITVSSQVPAVSLKGNGVSCFQEERGLSSRGKSVLHIYLMGFSGVSAFVGTHTHVSVPLETMAVPVGKSELNSALLSVGLREG